MEGTVITASFFGHLTPRVLARSGENTVRAAKDKYGVPTNHAQMISPACICIIKSVAPDTYKSNARIDAALEQDRQKLSDRNKHVLGLIVGTILLCGRQLMAVPMEE